MSLAKTMISFFDPLFSNKGWSDGFHFVYKWRSTILILQKENRNNWNGFFE